MKEKIIIFLIGLFLGSIISTGSIYVYTISTRTNNNINMGMPNDKGQGGMMENDENTPPEIPNDNQNNN